MKQYKLTILSYAILVYAGVTAAHVSWAQQFPYKKSVSKDGIFLEIVCDTPYVINGTAKGQARGIRQGKHAGELELFVDTSLVMPTNGKCIIDGVYDGKNTTWSTDFKVSLNKELTKREFADSFFDKDSNRIDTVFTYYTSLSVPLSLESEKTKVVLSVIYHIDEDSVLVDLPLCSRERMIEDSINYSKCYPNRRVNLDSAFWAIRHARNLLPFVENYFLDKIAFRLRWTPFPEQTERPLKDCFQVQPTFDSLAVTFQSDYGFYLDRKCDTTSLDSARTEFIAMMKMQLQTLYTLDQLIVSLSNQAISPQELIQQRNELLYNQKLDRKKFGERFRQRFKSIDSKP